MRLLSIIVGGDVRVRTMVFLAVFRIWTDKLCLLSFNRECVKIRKKPGRLTCFNLRR